MLLIEFTDYCNNLGRKEEAPNSRKGLRPAR